MVTKSCSKVAQNYFCKKCDYTTSKTSSYNKHLLTAKHVFVTQQLEKVAPTFSHDYTCENCNKNYKSRNGMWYHKKTCIVKEKKPTKDMDHELIQVLLKENQEFKQLIIEQSSKMLELATKPSSVTNINNNQFNLQLFLNDKCKNAMSITDFVNSIEIQSEDLEIFGSQGYVQGISNLFIRGLKDLDETVRPMHCTDKKRETLYIKDINGWDRDDKKDRMKEAIQNIAHKNFKYIPIWKEENEPVVSDVTTKKNDQYMRIANQVMTAITPDNDIGIKRIIKNVVNEVCLLDKINI
jgi:hypothetical protein